MNYSDMSGLELFTDPFSRPQAYNQPPSHSNSPATSQQKTATTKPKPVTAQAQQSNTTSKPVTPVETYAPQEKTKTPVPAQEQKPMTTEPAPAKTATLADAQPEPPKKTLELDMTTGAGTNSKAPDEDEQEKRKAHEEAEAKRKAEWEAKQLAKKQAEEEALQNLQSISDADIVSASTKRIRTAVERLTRRNMKECVADHIQNLCHNNPDFARRTMHPRKSMIHCFQYINRKARDYIQQEMKDNDIQPENGIYGGDVPDGIVYQWAVDYFNAPDAQEDRVKEEKFTPRPYVAAKSSSKSTKTSKKTSAKEPKKELEQKDDFQQMSLF